VMKINVYSAKGIRRPSIVMPKDWQEKENPALLAQVIRVYEDRRHPGLSKTKTRGEVTASTRKIWRQKGTGRARHGAVSAPIFVGGGVAHGPTGVKRQLSLPKKMRKKALKVALSLKAKNGELVVVDGISKLKKTKEAASLINEIEGKEKGIKGNAKLTFILSDKNVNAKLALRNIKNVDVVTYKDLNAYRVYLGGILVIDKEALIEKGARDIKSSKGIKGAKARKTER